MADTSLIGKTLGTSIIERQIGQGGMGAVYLARQTRPSRQVAIKVLQTNVALDSEVNKEFLARFRREADVIARLEHVNIITIYDYGEQDGIAYLVMPYLPKGSLRDVLTARGHLTLQETAAYIDQAARALDYAHAHKVIHRDLKPGNFLLHNDGRLVLADFGIARLLQESDNTFATTLTSTGMLLGTPEYMAPEVLMGKPIDARTDIYALGIVLFQLLSGQLPFKGGTPYAVANQHLQEPAPAISAINPAIPTMVDTVIQKAMAKDPNERYASAGELAQALQQAINAGDYPTARVEDNIPTVRSSPLSSTRVAAPPQQHTPPPAASSQYNIPSIVPAASQYPNTPPPAVPTHPNTLYGAQSAPSGNRTQPWLIFIGVLLVIVLVVGGVLVGLQLNKGAGGTTSTPSTNGSNSSAGSNSNGSNLTVGITPTPTLPPTVGTTPTSPPTPTPTPTSPSGVPKGTPLYTVSAPGSPCDASGGHWANYNSPNITCQGSSTVIGNPNSQSPNLVGTLLTSMPNSAFPSNYVIEVQLQEVSSTQADYGIYFRNQPGNQQGVYTFFIHSNGTWRTYVYDNTTGAGTEIAQGSLGGTVSSPTIDVVVNGANFSFYINNQLVGRANDSTYSSGTVGIAVDAGGTAIASTFGLYTIGGQ